jgi:malonyl CoA-acyl carrier protein transacylase
MGGDLFDRFPDWTLAADQTLGYSIKALCLEDPRGELGQTQFTQPALYVVNALTYRAREQNGGTRPDYVAGHSLGEYNALLAAGVFDFTTGLALVKERGRIMSAVRGGGMAAIVGLTPERIEEVLASTDEGRRLDVANFNSFEQTVIAGPKEDLDAMRPAFKAAGGRAIPLNVSAPFHSRYMRAAEEEFTAFVRRFELRPPAIPVISNATARPYDAQALTETLGRQIGSSVRWLETVVYLLDQGVTDFEEVGPGSVLTKLVGQIRSKRGQ